MKLSVIMPVFNEVDTVQHSINRLLSQKLIHQLVVIDDGSTDGTLKKIRNIKNKKIKIISHKKNKGKGAAIHTGIKHISGDYILIQDADLEYDPEDINELVKPIISNKAQVVYGSRFKGPHTNMFFWHYVGNNFLNLVVNILYNTTLSDMETCYKLIPAKLVKSFHLKHNDFGFEPEVTCKILKSGYRIYEVPISYSGRDYSQGKKLHWTQGIKALFIIFSERISN